MKINRIEFIKAVEETAEISNVNKIRPILENVYMRSQNGNVEFIATDLSNTIIKSVLCNENDVNVVFEPSLVLEYVKQLEAEEIEIKIDETMQIDGAEFSIFDYSEFPKVDIETKNEIKIESKILLKYFKRALFAAGKDDNVALNCIRLDIENETINIVSTDTFKMLKSKEKTEAKEKINASIPTSCMKSLLNMLSQNITIKISKEKNFIVFYDDVRKLKVRTISLDFPNCEAIFQTEENLKTTIEMNKIELIKTLKRIDVFARENETTKSAAVFDFKNNKLEIKAVGKSGKAKEKVDTIKIGNDLKICLNIRFIIDFLNNTDGQTAMFKFLDDKTACMMIDSANENFKCMMMPIVIINND